MKIEFVAAGLFFKSIFPTISDMSVLDGISKKGYLVKGIQNGNPIMATLIELKGQNYMLSKNSHDLSHGELESVVKVFALKSEKGINKALPIGWVLAKI
jgi:hypothetical protein